jgi:hypothetical protein
MGYAARRRVDELAVAPELALPEALHELVDRLQVRRAAAAEPGVSAEHRSDDHAVVRSRHAREIVDEIAEAPVAEEVELDVRGVERGETLAPLSEICRDGRERAWAAQVAYDGNHEVALLQRFDELERALGREVVAALAEAVGCQQQFAKGGVVPCGGRPVD